MQREFIADLRRFQLSQLLLVLTRQKHLPDHSELSAKNLHFKKLQMLEQ